MNSYRDRTIQAFDKLTPLLKKVAEHVLHHPVIFAQEPAAKVAHEIGVSETTVIRFCTAIDYRGFTDFQKDVRTALYTNQPQKSIDQDQANDQFLQNFIQRELKHLKSTLEKIEPSHFHEAVNRICTADRVLISGSYNSYSMAHWLWYSLGQYLDQVHLFHPGTDNITHQLNQLGENSLLFTCSFHRYALDSIWLSEEAKKKGVYTISVTDSPIAPILKHSDLYFQVESYSEDTFETSPAVAYGILHALVTGVEGQMNSQKDVAAADFDYRLKKFFI